MLWGVRVSKCSPFHALGTSWLHLLDSEWGTVIFYRCYSVFLSSFVCQSVFSCSEVRFLLSNKRIQSANQMSMWLTRTVNPKRACVCDHSQFILCVLLTLLFKLTVTSSSLFQLLFTFPKPFSPSSLYYSPFTLLYFTISSIDRVPLTHQLNHTFLSLSVSIVCFPFRLPLNLAPGLSSLVDCWFRFSFRHYRRTHRSFCNNSDLFFHSRTCCTWNSIESPIVPRKNTLEPQSMARVHTPSFSLTMFFVFFHRQKFTLDFDLESCRP